MSNRDVNVAGKMIKEAQETLKARNDIAYGNEPATHELFMDREGKTFVQAITNEGDDINTITSGCIVISGTPLEEAPKGMKITPNSETAQYIQSWYENRRD
ncbi:hypothetical protein [Priestia megaterium]|uniref:hypothetical protein n=1 Tax=Priestia megaterium TaxID=1404 RepID=UPI000CA3580E|nr:hypothetical protein [Priestia megaterium]AUO14786.1 hypothetical protein C0569_26230 [Priestia megaterium]